MHPSNVISPANPASAAGTPVPDTNRTNLLNLLKFGGNASKPEQASGPMANLQNIGRTASMHLPSVEGPQSRDSTTANLLSSLRSKSTSTPADARNPEIHTTQSNSQQELLLGLLNKSTGSQSAVKAETAEKPTAPRAATPVRQFGSPVLANSQFESPKPSKASAFNYVNPFDQLHTSSPLNRSRTPKQEAGPSRKIEPLKHSRDLASNSSDVAPPTKSRKVNEPATNIKAESVSEALGDVGEKVDKEVEQALAEASTSMADESAKRDKVESAKESTEVIDSSWESAEDEAALNEQEGQVVVYNFPMKPYLSLQIKQSRAARPVRKDNVLVIATLKKEFDQIDRALVTASHAHIVYAQVATKKDNGGFRIIRQDTGDHKQVFRSSGERIFHVQLCSSDIAGHDVETVMGTGVNGALYWTSLSKGGGDHFSEDDVEAGGFILPAVATPDENTSGSPVKTRAKMSSRHPEFFAMARGKQIFIIAPDMVKATAYCHPSTRMISSEKYFAEHSIKLNTGKAGKDFCFSEDDSVIASLDKNGRFKFWDIRELTARACDLSESKHEPVELRDPLWTLTATSSGDEKPSVSSIMFLDKERPTIKGMALRYVLIGFKQNHILQLWDLGLGNAVQEIRFPHDKDSDGICSINYQAKTGIIALGHPTRNSIYYIHLSAPKYNIPHAIDQARYISMLVRKDPALPKPESTAIMSGLRELSFANVGQLRSVDMLKAPIWNGSEVNSAEETLFELYAMHAKGVTSLPIKRMDLGWDENNKMLNPKDAQKEGVIDISDLLPPQKLPVSNELPIEQASSNAGSSKSIKAAAIKKADNVKPTEVKAEIKKEAAETPTVSTNGTKSASEVSKKQTLELSSTAQKAVNPPLMTAESYNITPQRTKYDVKEKAVPELASPSKISSISDKPSAISSVPSNPDHSMLDKKFETLYQRLDADKRVQEAAGGAKQDALLRLVSSTLTDNVGRSLLDIVTTRVKEDVVPAVKDITSKHILDDVVPALSSVTKESVDRKLSELVPQQLTHGITSALKTALPAALQEALRTREIHQTISNITANQVATKVQQQVSVMLQGTLPDMATQATQQMVTDLEKRTNEQLRQAETQRRKDNAKIEELTTIVRSLSTTIQNMATSQAAFQAEILKMQREAQSAAISSEVSNAVASERSAEPEDTELMAMERDMKSGGLEQATIQVCAWDRTLMTVN